MSRSVRQRSPVSALVLDAHLKSSLAAIRSLGRRGIPVIAGSHRATAMGLFSRYPVERMRYPPPLEDRRGFVASILRKAASVGRLVVLAFSDSTLLPLLDDARVADHCLLLRPAPRGFEIAFDKGRTLELAASLGVPIPATVQDLDGRAVDELASRFGYPVVVKPRRSVYWTLDGGNAGVHVSARFARDKHECESLSAEFFQETGELPLIQQLIRGEEASVQFMCDRGTIVAACANRRMRSSHPSGGPGVVKQTVPLSYAGMEDHARRLAKHLQWTGPMMVEFKLDGAGGLPHLMEINGRFWGSLPLAVFAGVDFPSLYYQMAAGESYPVSAEYQERLISRHFMGDLHHLYWTLFKSDPLRHASFRNRADAVRDFLLPPFRYKSDVADIHDPLPMMAEFLDTAANAIRFPLTAQAVRQRPAKGLG